MLQILISGHERFYNPELLMPSFLMSSYAQAAAAYAVRVDVVNNNNNIYIF